MCIVTLLSLEEGSVFTHSHTISSSLVAFNTINVMTHQSPALPSPESQIHYPAANQYVHWDV